MKLGSMEASSLLQTSWRYIWFKGVVQSSTDSISMVTADEIHGAPDSPVRFLLLPLLKPRHYSASPSWKVEGSLWYILLVIMFSYTSAPKWKKGSVGCKQTLSYSVESVVAGPSLKPAEAVLKLNLFRLSLSLSFLWKIFSDLIFGFSLKGLLQPVWLILSQTVLFFAQISKSCTCTQQYSFGGKSNTKL